jgi:hypothetical protein
MIDSCATWRWLSYLVATNMASVLKRGLQVPLLQEMVATDDPSGLKLDVIWYLGPRVAESNSS